MKTIQDIPVLFFPFSRPQYARQVFDAIKKAKPKRFYFYCDKAREGYEEELKNNNIIRDYIKEVDWNCNLKTWFRDENIGVYISILNAIDWFFDNEEMGIILEEDCLPSLAFFDFCRQLLPKYKDDFRVWSICGNNFIESCNPNKYDYIFTTFAYQWGWATWKSRWKKINRDGFSLDTIKKYKLYDQLYANKKGAKSAYRFIEKQADNDGIYRPVSWDYIFNISRHCYGGIGIIPRENLVSNIGTWGTNSKGKSIYHNRKIPVTKTYEIKNVPPFVVSDFHYNQSFIKSIKLKRKPIIYRVYLKLFRFFKTHFK